MPGGSFRPGSQLEIARKLRGVLPYHHHAIYVDDDEVIEFGGTDLFDAKVRSTSLLKFSDGGRAEMVQHPRTWPPIIGQQYSPYLPAEETIDRARWLIENQPPTYWVAHRNCEYVANWCATGDFESFQTKKAIGIKLAVSYLPLIYAMKHSTRRTHQLLVAGSLMLTAASAVPYLMDNTLPDHLRTYPGLHRNRPTS